MRRRRALTLVELLAALSLLALLTVALLAVTRATARDAALRVGAAAPPAWRDRLARRLADDLAQSLSVAPAPAGLNAGLNLEGWSDRDPAALTPRHRAVRIGWRLRGGGLWREARPLVAGGPGVDTRPALAAAGVVGFTVDRGAVVVRFADPALAPLRVPIPRGVS